MSRTRRRGIDRGKEHDYEIVEEEFTGENVERFYRTYEQVMDRVDGETYPLSFFEALERLESRVLLVTLRIDGEYAGGLLELLDDEQSTVYGFKAAIPKDYFEYNASELLYDYVIRWAIEHGYETYDLGISNPDFDDGVFRFKEGFGGRVVPTLVWERATGVTWKLVKIGREKYNAYNR